MLLVIKILDEILADDNLVWGNKQKKTGIEIDRK